MIVYKTKNNNIGCWAIAFFLSIYIGIACALTFWTDRTLDFWLTHFKGEVVDVPYWLSFLTTLVLSPIVVGANLLSEIVRFFMF